MTDLIDIHGVCAPGYEAVREAFAANFTEAPEGLNEQAARFTVLVEGETVVDLWAGHADTARTTPFTDTTLTSVFSTGKAVMAILMASAVEESQIGYDQTVASLWPEFGAAGKAEVTVAQLMSHQSGLPGFSEAVDPTIWFDVSAVLARLAAQSPMWAPGSASGYHPITVGYLANEVYRRATGRTMGQALRQDFPELDLWIGLPESEHGRVAQMRKPTAAPSLGTIDPIKQAAFLDRGSAPGGRGSAEWREMEIPSANLHGTALGLARMHGRGRQWGRSGGTVGAVGRDAGPVDARADPRPGQGAALCDQLGGRSDAQRRAERLRAGRSPSATTVGAGRWPWPTRRVGCRPPM
jgi:CubicO group peptidase (beta-lactamase class C family)